MKKIIDFVIYLFVIVVDSISFNLYIRLDLGTNPFGIMVNNLSHLISISPGIVAFSVGLTQIIIASKLRKSRVKIELLIYNLIFSVFVDLMYPLFKSFSIESLFTRIIILIAIIVVLDFSRSLFQLVKYPRLSLIELLYGICEHFTVNLKVASRINNLILISLGIIFSIMNNQAFKYLGIGTIITVYLTGICLNYFTPRVKKYYEAFFNMYDL